MYEKSEKGAVVEIVKEIGLKVKFIIYLKDFTNILAGRGGKLSKGGILNSKSNLNTGEKIVFNLGIRPIYNRGCYYNRGAIVPYTTS